MMSPEVIREVTRMTKAELVEWKVAHGTIYPDRAGLFKWSKDQLVNAVIMEMEGDVS